MKRYKHKATSIQEVDNRKFISEAEKLSIQDAYSSKTQITNIDNIGTINSTIEGFGEVEFVPKSLINLLEVVNDRYSFIVGSGGSDDTEALVNKIVTPNDITVTFDTLTKGFSYTYFFIGGNRFSYKIKPNTKYTFFADVYFSKPYNAIIHTAIHSGDGTGLITDQVSVSKLSAGWTRLKFTLTTLEFFDNNSNDRVNKRVYIRVDPSANILSGLTIKIKNAMFIEGDVPMSEYPGYFEGYTSVLDKPAEIITNGTNLLDINKITHSNASILDLDPSRGLIKFKKKETGSGTFIKYENFKVKPNTDYSISYNVSCDGNTIDMNTFVYDENSKYYDSYPLMSGNITVFNSGNWNSVNIGIYVGSDISETSTFTITNLRLNEGNEVLPFEIYKESIIPIGILSLKELPYGIRDEINGNKLIKRVGKIILNGSEGWYDISEANGIPSDSRTLGFFCDNTDNKPWNMKHINKHISDRFTNYGTNSMWQSGGDVEQIGTWSHGGSINIRISKSRGINNVNDFINWLKNNPVTVYYELENPTVEIIDIEKIGTYYNKTHIKTNSDFHIPMKVTTKQDVQSNILSMKDEVIKQSNKISSLKEVQLSILNNLV